MEKKLYLRSFPDPPTRRATLFEFVLCITGLLACFALAVISLTFMAVDFVFPDTSFRSVLDFKTWQLVNYTLNALFTGIGVVISRNMLSLYTAVQRSLLISASRCQGKIPAVALTTPGLVTAYRLRRSRVDYPLVLTSLVTALVPVLSATSTFLVDFKLTTQNITKCTTGQNISAQFDSIDSLFADYQMNGTAMGEWAALSALVQSSTVARIRGTTSPFFPHDFLTYDPDALSSDGDSISIQFSGTTFIGNSTYGFHTVRHLWWSGATVDPDVGPVVTELLPATTLRAERTAPGQSTAFTCDELPFTNFSGHIAMPPSANPATSNATPAMVQYSVFTQGPCFSRTSTFVVGTAPNVSPLAHFDIQTCHTDSELQLQFVAVSPGSGDPATNYTVDAYSCSSAVLEGRTRGEQPTPSDIHVFPPTEELHAVSSSALSRYAAHLNVYFGLATYPLSDSPIPTAVGTGRSQGAWTSTLRHNWERTPAGATYWPGQQFLEAYADALVANIGTYLATLNSAAQPLAALSTGGPCESFHTIEKQVLRLGAPVKAGAPLLVVVAVILLAHGALLWLYTQKLPELQTDQSVDMLLKVETRELADMKAAVAALCSEDDAETVPLLALPYVALGEKQEATKSK